jgi:hypothetical protein
MLSRPRRVVWDVVVAWPTGSRKLDTSVSISFMVEGAMGQYLLGASLDNGGEET